MKNRHAIVIEASPEEVFPWLDDAERVMAWVPNLVENEDLNLTEDHVGSTFRQVYVENGRRMEMQGVVTEYEVNRRLVAVITGATFELGVAYSLEDLGGRTRITQVSVVRFKGLFKLVGPIMSLFLRKSSMRQLEESFARLKALAEGGDTGVLDR